ncbi:unnamed protein product [Prunus armeniaca]|uniref:Uncharacterized protein n=1 Tax=Prunus armeniaca TaxID=36596 RepID=A0A6J5X917_PRUAR|nr:unnamed protein product [Prunus armeniaca]
MLFMKPKCLWGEKNMWKKLVQPYKEQQQMKMVKKELTLEEWFLASSPCEKDDNSLCNIKEGDSEKNWLYPCLGGEDSDDFTSMNSRDSFTLQRLLTIEMVDSGKSDAHAPCLCRSESSGKVKKRVSFRLPEEADIFIFCSPDQGDYKE